LVGLLNNVTAVPTSRRLAYDRHHPDERDTICGKPHRAAEFWTACRGSIARTMDWIYEVAEIVKTAPDAQTGWPALIELCRLTQPSELWSAIPKIEPQRDVSAAAKWLRGQLHSAAAPDPARGVYLGLDTLNMEGTGGHNVEIGATKECDPFKLESEWAWHCEWYGESHLIAGLKDLKRVYEAPEFEPVSGFADYALFLGYSGLVLAQAMEALKVSAPLLAAWGFHDGDLFFLGRRETKRFERICKIF
jgi:hypothetical protein